MRARTALLILLILVLAVPVASGARITLEERIFLDSPGSGAVPVATSVFAGGTYIAVVASKGSDTVIYVVDPARGEVVLNRTLKDALPLCAEALGDGSLSVIVTPGKSSVEEIIVTPDLNVLSGLEYRADLPVIFSGCTHQGRNVLVYGEAVVKGRSLEAYASMLNPAGIPLATATWGGPGDQILKEVASANGMIVAAVSNTSSNRVDLYRLQLTPGSLLPVYLGSAPLLGVLLDAMVFGDGVALLEATSSTPTSGYLVVFENNESTIYPLPGGGVGLSFAGESNGHTAIVGFVPNTTTGLSDGMIALLRTGQWRLEAIDIAYGAKSVSYTCGTYAGEASVIVAGT
ncbi:MAG: hypothetical protein F7C34_04745, partial [Desulfurococcales archaeon]|nr:hypothetical protein [Desulfurococcales archaeon]